MICLPLKPRRFPFSHSFSSVSVGLESEEGGEEEDEDWWGEGLA